jgi:hypothetical protein
MSVSGRVARHGSCGWTMAAPARNGNAESRFSQGIYPRISAACGANHHRRETAGSCRLDRPMPPKAESQSLSRSGLGTNYGRAGSSQAPRIPTLEFRRATSVESSQDWLELPRGVAVVNMVPLEIERRCARRWAARFAQSVSRTRFELGPIHDRTDLTISKPRTRRSARSRRRGLRSLQVGGC